MSKMRINEIFIKVSGKYPIPQKLEMGQDVELRVKGSVVKKEVLDQQDGSVDINFIIKPIEVKIIE